MKQQSRTVPRRRQSASPAPRHLPLVEILVDTQAELQELVVASGLKVLEAMLEEDRGAVCGPRYAHQPERQAYRPSHTPSQVVLGGRKVAMHRPRARRDGAEVPLPTVRAFTDTDPLNRRVVAQMLIGVATRQYARSLHEPLGATLTTRGTRKSAVSDALWPRPSPAERVAARNRSTGCDLAVLLIVGVQVGRTDRGRVGHLINHGCQAVDSGKAPPRMPVCQRLLTDLARRAPPRPQHLAHRRWGEGQSKRGDPAFGPGRPLQPLHIDATGRTIRIEHLPEASPAVGEGDPQTHLHEHARSTTAKRLLFRTGSGSLDADYPSAFLRRERPRRPRRHADCAGPGSVGAPPTIAGHHERH